MGLNSVPRIVSERYLYTERLRSETLSALMRWNKFNNVAVRTLVAVEDKRNFREKREICEE
jgi:hypothetical protein